MPVSELGSRGKRISLVSPDVWEPLLQEEFERLDDKAAHFARVGLLTLHDRHVGITPKLMAELAPMLTRTSARPPDESPWAQTLKRLAMALMGDDAGEGMTRRPLRLGLLFSRIPSYALLRVAAPVVEFAARRIHVMYLFCGDDRDTNVTRRQYRAYSDLLDWAVIEQAADEQDQTLDLFWKERALTIKALSDPNFDQISGSSDLPNPDPLATALLIRLKPDADRAKLSQVIRRPTSAQTLRSSRRREGGMEGIRVASSMDDIDIAITSEWLNDPITKLDRFANTGYLAIEHRPKRTKDRDFLVVGMMPGGFWDSTISDILKASWFDFANRLGLILRKLNMVNTEFRWIEGDRFDRSRSFSLNLKDVENLPTGGMVVPNDAYRTAFLANLNWLPQYLDSRSEYKRVNLLGSRSGSRELSVQEQIETRAFDWVAAAWNIQQESPSWKNVEMSVGASSRLRADEFAVVNVMLFMPQEDDAADDSESRTALASITGKIQRINGFSGSASITRVPTPASFLPGWRFIAQRRSSYLLFPGEDPQASLSELTGNLIVTWMNHVLSEVGVA